MNALRLYQGTSFDIYEQRTGLSIKNCKQKIQQAIAAGLLEDSNEIKTTHKGQLFLNELLEKFL